MGALVVTSMVTGCLSLDEPSPSTQPSLGPTPSPAATAAARDPDTLIVAVPEYPASLLPPAQDEASQLLLDLLYDPLYRLDEHQVPRPRLAADLPSVSDDGLTWTIDLASGDPKFADGSPITAADVVASLRIARSPTCSLGRDLCTAALATLDGVEAVNDHRVRLTLSAPDAPLLAEVLAQLPILEGSALEAGAKAIVAAASSVAADAPDKLVTRIYKAVGDDGCLVTTPPAGCALSDHTADLETMLTNAGLPLPSSNAFLNESGQLDAAAYANELLDRVASLGQVLSRTGTDRFAAALPLMDLSQRTLGSGAYRIVGGEPGVSVELAAVAGHLAGPPGIPRIILQVIADPAVAATRLLSGDVDWVIQTDMPQATAMRTLAGVGVGLRPLPSQWSIVFNTRDGRLYADERVRRAFALCVDRAGLTASTGGGEAIEARTPLTPGSWAMTPPAARQRDVAGADQLLDEAGWVRGADGIRTHGGKRLSSSIALRSSQASLLAFVQGVSTQLQDCGIELQVQDLDLTGDSLLQQLRWPNDFDTLLTMRTLAADPDPDVQAFESSHATSADQEVDANPGGFHSTEADKLIREARRTTARAARTGLYGRLQDVLDTSVPTWPIWYDTEWAAIADRVRGPDGAIDTSVPDYAWDIPAWTLEPIAP